MRWTINTSSSSRSGLRCNAPIGVQASLSTTSPTPVVFGVDTRRPREIEARCRGEKVDLRGERGREWPDRRAISLAGVRWAGDAITPSRSDRLAAPACSARPTEASAHGQRLVAQRRGPVAGWGYAQVLAAGQGVVDTASVVEQKRPPGDDRERLQTPNSRHPRRKPTCPTVAADM